MMKLTQMSAGSYRSGSSKATGRAGPILVNNFNFILLSIPLLILEVFCFGSKEPKQKTPRISLFLFAFFFFAFRADEQKIKSKSK